MPSEQWYEMWEQYHKKYKSVDVINEKHKGLYKSPKGMWFNCREDYLKYQRMIRAKCRRNNPVSKLLALAKQRCKKSGREFSITTKDVPIPDICPVLGIPIRVNFGGKGNDNSPSIDRIDNSKGYIPGNVCVISQRANILKGDATLEELELILKDLQ